MNDASEIVNEIGRSHLAGLLGVVETSISNSVKKGKFPARWYKVVSEECSARGMDCPFSLFSFTGSESQGQAGGSS